MVLGPKRQAQSQVVLGVAGARFPPEEQPGPELPPAGRGHMPAPVLDATEAGRPGPCPQGSRAGGTLPRGAKGPRPPRKGSPCSQCRARPSGEQGPACPRQGSGGRGQAEGDRPPGGSAATSGWEARRLGRRGFSGPAPWWSLPRVGPGDPLHQHRRGPCRAAGAGRRADTATAPRNPVPGSMNATHRGGVPRSRGRTGAAWASCTRPCKIAPDVAE